LPERQKQPIAFPKFGHQYVLFSMAYSNEQNGLLFAFPMGSVDQRAGT
jgi:hypothetical protein